MLFSLMAAGDGFLGLLMADGEEDFEGPCLSKHLAAGSGLSFSVRSKITSFYVIS